MLKSKKVNLTKLIIQYWYSEPFVTVVKYPFQFVPFHSLYICSWISQILWGRGECQHWCPLLLLFSPVRITGSSLRTTEQMSVLSITVESHTSLLRVFLNGSSLFAPDIPHRLWSSVRVQGEKSICLAGWRGFSQNPQSDPQLCLRRCCFVTSEVLTFKQSSLLTLTATTLSVYSFDVKMTFFKL